MSERSDSGSDVPQHDRFADDAHRYSLVSRLATGGMGEVWRGRDTVLGRPVAVKLLKAEYADDRLFRQRFETEAQHAASLHHPGIAAVFDFGEAAPLDGSGTPRPYLVMELVEGQPLSDLLRPSSPMDPDVTRDLMAQTADALGAAHAAGIVHRDVKPGNLIVTPDRRVKVTDFGIARAAEGLALTETGQVLGTPAYLSPEQAEGGTATAASDVYSLGVVAYECLAGRRPFVAESAVATALAHLRQPVPELPPQVPAPLAAVVTRALAKDPHERYADAPAFAAALRDPSSATPGTSAAPVAAGAPVPASAPTSPPTQVLPVTSAGAVPAAAAATPPQPAAQPAPRAPGGQRTAGWVPWALLAAVVVVAGLVIWQLVVGDDASEQAAEDPAPIRSSRTQTDPPSETPTETPTPTPSETPSETVTETPTVEVDPADYVGRDREEVEAELGDLGLDVSAQEIANPGDQVEGTTASVEPSGTLEEGSSVVVSYYGAAAEPEDGDEEPGTGPGTGQGNGQGNGPGENQGNDQGEGNG